MTDEKDAFRLVRPKEEYAEEIARFRTELIEENSAADGCGGLLSFEDPMEFIEACRLGENSEAVRAGFVRATQFLYIDEETGKIAGMIQVRHELNDALAKLGGHIGYCVRPSMRGHGLAKGMLEEALVFCWKNLGLPWVMISTHRDNPASEHTILACGGKLSRIVIDPENGKEACIYIITRRESNG